MKTKKSRKEAVIQLERIRKEFDNREPTYIGALIVPPKYLLRYRKICAIFERLYGSLPTLGERAMYCKPESLTARLYMKKLQSLQDIRDKHYKQ